MKFISIFFTAIVLPVILSAQTLSTIVDNGPDNRLINLVILGDGYTSAEQNKFNADALDFTNELFATPPYSNYENFFNVYGVFSSSAQSGATHPGTGSASDENMSTYPIQTVSTVYASEFDINGIHRLLVPQNPAAVYTDLAAVMPNYDQIIVLVNVAEYGGSGGTIATSSTTAAEIAIHELGHSFADLNDEYYAGDDFASEAPNMTIDNNPLTNRWREWLGINGIGITQHTCSEGNCSDWYKPINLNCKMESLDKDFCSVCKEATVDAIYDLVIPGFGKFPSGASTTIFNNKNENFGATIIYPIPNTTQIEWEINNVLQAGKNSDNEVFGWDDFNLGANTLTMIIRDETALSKSYQPALGYEFSVSWTVNKVDRCIQQNDISVSNYTNIFPFGYNLTPYQLSTDDFDWTINAGTTPTMFTGPGAAFSGINYVYAEANGQAAGNVASFITDCVDLTNVFKPQLDFHYHMWSTTGTMGDLEVFISTTAGSPYLKIGTISGNQGNQWNQWSYDLVNYVGEAYVTFLFRATRGSSNLSDIAIDNIKITERCADSYTLNLAQNSDRSYYANDFITSESVLGAGIDVLYNAENSVELLPGFDCPETTIFNVKLDGCQ